MTLKRERPYMEQTKDGASPTFPIYLQVSVVSLAIINVHGVVWQREGVGVERLASVVVQNVDRAIQKAIRVVVREFCDVSARRPLASSG